MPAADPEALALTQRVVRQADVPADAAYGSAGTLRIPGTLALVAVFFIAFVLYYFVNWKYLSEIWPMR